MTGNRARRPLPVLLALLVTVPLAAAAAPSSPRAPSTYAKTGAESLPPARAASDTALAGHLIQPQALARLLADSTATQPMLVHVGFKSLYHGGHIPRSRYFGPASKPEGLAALKKALAEIPREQPVVLYCGCCPWTDCPNVGPAFRAAQDMGFKSVRVLYVAKNLEHDWVEKGFPITVND
jgi:hypothetical protein